MKPYRLLFEFFDTLYLGNERILYENVINFRAFVKQLIDERKEQLKKEDSIGNSDFLSLLLADTLYKDDEKMMIDETLAFLFAST
mmetsp:Transcript_30466/g.29847  ORF Transcript_30466/g.29847 Transcript_30466/m.29847 type:complete len:85 (+) Transcript_30466:726-980(+)